MYSKTSDKNNDIDFMDLQTKVRTWINLSTRMNLGGYWNINDPLITN